MNGPKNEDNVAEFESAWTIANSVYPYFSFKHIRWDSIHTVYLPQAERAKGDEIFTVLYHLIGELKDGHARVTTTGGFTVATYAPPRAKRDQLAYSPIVVRKYFSNELKLAGNKNMEYEFLPGNIGYVRVSTFVEGSWIQDFHGILEYFHTSNGLIIDVRQNGGGSTINSDVIVSRFLNAPLPVIPAYIGGQLQSTGQVQPGGPFRYVNPVVVIINGDCMSATEQFAEMMKQISNVTLLGDTTAGMSGNPKYYSLPSGRQIRISTTDYRRYDGSPIEWNGVPPDILVQQTEDDVRQGRDKQLEQAIHYLQ